jgi:asparagine synthase (glutamine-hydrolysing)
VSRLASRHVKVVLTGEGSDEIFGGYERYRWSQLNLRMAEAYRFLPEPIRRGLRDLIQWLPLLRADPRRKLGHTVLERDLSIESLLLDNFYAAFSEAEQRSLLRGAPGEVYGAYLRYWNSRPAEPLLNRMLYADQKTYLVELLMKQDQMTMATSVESRVPFLDHHFVEFAMGAPGDLKIRGGTQKYLLKQAVEDLLPRDIVYRPKMGFPTPLRQWLRAPESAHQLRALTSADSFCSQWIRPEAAANLIGRHRSGAEDATDKLWRLLNLELWGGLFFGERGAREEAAGALEAVHG